MSVVSPTPGLMDHLSCSSPVPAGGGSTSMKTEHLALIGFAARLGTSMTSDAAEATKTREDAQLLMSLLHPKSLPRENDAGAMADGTKDAARRSHPNESGSGLNGNSGVSFSFACPSLSIDADRDRTNAGGAMPTPGEGSERADDAVQRAHDDPSPPPRPSQLFRRSVFVNDRDGVKDAVESVARNVMQSFSVALEWRCMAWIDSLSKVLSLKESLIMAHHHHYYGYYYGEEAEEEQEREYEEEQEAWEEEEQEEADAASVDEECEDDASEQEQEEEDGQDDFFYSKEMTLIDALARVISEVSVRDVKTAFRVLPQVTDKEVTPSRVSSAPPPKKRRIRQVTLEDDIDPGKVTGRNKQYDITHGIFFEAIITVSTGTEERQVTLSAPGSIVGTFLNCTGGAGEEVLTGVTVDLDTDALALSMERNSRLLIRKAAEADMSSASVQPSSDEYAYSSDVPEMSTTAYADAYPQAAVVTPKHGISPPSSFSSGGSERDITGDLTIPPPVPCFNFGIDDDASPPKTVSPTQMSESDAASWCLFSPKDAGTARSVLPLLVSPSPTRQHHEEEVPRAEESEWYSFRGKKVSSDAPSLPALVEVACAAMCATT